MTDYENDRDAGINRINIRTKVHVKQIKPNEWAAAVKFKGEWIRALGGTCQEDAIILLEEDMNEMELPIPHWDVHIIPSLVTPSVSTEVKAAFKTAHEFAREPNYPSADSGYITPNTDLGKWIGIYKEAERIASALGTGERQANIISIPGAKRDDTQTRFKDCVNTYMIENSALGAFTSGPNGQNYLLIANLLGAGLHNPLGRGFRRNEGRFRDNGNRNINNNFVPAESSDVRRLDPKTGKVIDVIKIQRMTEEEMIDAVERKAHKQAFGHTDDFVSRKSKRMRAERASETSREDLKEAKKSKAIYDHGNPDQRKAAFRFGQRMSSDVKSHGGSTDDCRDAYKFGVCKTYREMGLPPFTAWEEILKDTKWASEILDTTVLEALDLVAVK